MHFSKPRVHRILCLVKIQCVYLDQLRPTIFILKTIIAKFIEIKENQTDADNKVLDFVKKHPYSSKKEKAYLNVGNYYFVNRKGSHALKWYSKVMVYLEHGR